MSDPDLPNIFSIVLSLALCITATCFWENWHVPRLSKCTENIDTHFHLICRTPLSPSYPRCCGGQWAAIAYACLEIPIEKQRYFGNLSTGPAVWDPRLHHNWGIGLIFLSRHRDVKRFVRGHTGHLSSIKLSAWEGSRSYSFSQRLRSALRYFW